MVGTPNPPGYKAPNTPWGGPTRSGGQGQSTPTPGTASRGAMGPALPQGPAGPVGGPGALGPAGPAFPPAPTAPKSDPGADFLKSPLAQFMASLGNQNAGVGSYLNQFQSSLGAARSNIQQQLGAALADIQNSQNAAGQALGQLPAQIDASYGQAQHTTGSALQAIQGAQAKSGVGSLMDLGAYMQPVQAAVSGSQAAAHANVPLLQTGIQQEGDRMRAQANMAAMAQQGQLDQLGAQGMLQAGLAQSGQNGGLTPQQQFQEQLLLRNMDNDQRMKEIKEQKSGSNSGAAAGAYGTNGLSQADVTSAHTSPQYSTFAQQIASGQIKSLADLQKALPGNPTLWRTLAVDFSLQ